MVFSPKSCDINIVGEHEDDREMEIMDQLHDQNLTEKMVYEKLLAMCAATKEIKIVGELEDVREMEIMTMEQLHAQNLAEKMVYEKQLEMYAATKDWSLRRGTFK